MYNYKVNEAKLNSLALADLGVLIGTLQSQQEQLLELEAEGKGALYPDDQKAQEQHDAKLHFLELALNRCWTRKDVLVAEIFKLETPDGQDAFQVFMSDHEAPFA
jgi:hypothetical protein